MLPISATVITCNEEHNIAEALQSLSWVDEIIIVDSGSRDATLDICRGFTDRIYHRDWTGYVDQKNFAVEKARNDWILSLDADERVSRQLQDEILTRLWHIPPENVRTRTIDMHVTRIREKLRDDPAQPRVVLTVRGKGYMFGEAG